MAAIALGASNGKVFFKGEDGTVIGVTTEVAQEIYGELPCFIALSKSLPADPSITDEIVDKLLLMQENRIKQ